MPLAKALARAWLTMRRALPDTIAEYAQLVANLTLAASALIVVIQYAGSRHDVRVSRTLDLLERFEGETYAGPRKEVEATLGLVQSTVRASLTTEEWTALGPDDKARLVAKVTRIQVYGPDETGALPSAFASVTGFFNSLQICIEKRVCDGRTAHGFFDSYAETFWSALQPVIERERNADRPGFAKDMERFVQARGAAP